MTEKRPGRNATVERGKLAPARAMLVTSKIIYKATVVSSNISKAYISNWQVMLLKRERFNNHSKLFKHSKYEIETELSSMSED